MDDKQYKARITNKVTGAEVQIKALKVNDNVVCLDFTRKKGELIDFLNQFKKISAQLSKNAKTAVY